MQALKDNQALQFAVVTGCLKIAKESIFTGTNNTHEFQTNAERILIGNSEFTPALDSPISVGVKSNDFVL